MQSFLRLLIRFGILASPTEEAGQGQNRVRLRARAVSMKTHAIWSMQFHGHISTIDGTSIDRCDKEIRQFGNVLRGRRGDSEAYNGRRCVSMHEKVRTKVQTVKVRVTQRLNQILGEDGG